MPDYLQDPWPWEVQGEGPSSRAASKRSEPVLLAIVVAILLLTPLVVYALAQDVLGAGEPQRPAEADQPSVMEANREAAEERARARASAARGR